MRNTLSASWRPGSPQRGRTCVGKASTPHAATVAHSLHSPTGQSVKPHCRGALQPSAGAKVLAPATRAFGGSPREPEGLASAPELEGVPIIPKLSSLASTRAPSVSADSTPQSETEQAPWSLERACFLCGEDGKDAFLNRVKLLDTSLGSVARAVKLLNMGVIYCPEDFCVVYGAANQGYYLLYRQGCQELAYAQLDLATPTASTPRCSTPTRTRAHVELLQTPPRFRVPSPAPALAAAESAPAALAPGTPMAQHRRLAAAPTPQAAEAGTGRPSRHTHRRRSLSPKRPEPEQGPPSGQRPPATTLPACESEAGAGAAGEAQQVPQGLRHWPQSYVDLLSRTIRGQADGEQADALSRTMRGQIDGEQMDSSAVSTVTASSTVAEGEQAQAAREVPIGDRTFRLQRILGRGAFGVVWKAFESGTHGEGQAVAVKAMQATSQENFVAATFEAELLRLLALQLPAGSRDRVPRYVAHSAVRCRTGGNVHIAMSFIPGVVLDQWMYGITDEEHKRVDVTKIVGGGLPGSRQRSMPFSSTCSFVSELILQLSGVFAALQPIAFHRDISSHNVLVDLCEKGSEGPKPSFAVIDFGLAVKSGSWHQDWNSSNLAGDPRYWTPAAWMALAFGFRHVEMHPNRGYHRQYLGRMDHYSLGILGLEAFFSLWDPDSRSAEDPAPGMLEARVAWCALWDAIFRLFQMFHLQGAKSTQHFIEHSPQNVMGRIGGLLTQLCHALRQAAVQPANACYAPLLRILADLADENGGLSWAEVMAGLRPTEPDTPTPTTTQKITWQWPREREERGEGQAADCRRTHDALPSPTALPEVVRYEVAASPHARASAVRPRVRSLSPSAPRAAPTSFSQQLGTQLFSQNAQGALAVLGAAKQSSYVPPMAQEGADRLSYVPPVVTKQASYVPPPTGGHNTSWVPSQPSSPVYVSAAAAGPAFYVLPRRMSFSSH